MKYIFALTFLMLSTTYLLAQTPEKISYQAIIRTNTNDVVSNSDINLKIIIRQGAITGTNIYEETHFIKTNVNGLVSLEIGTGSVIKGVFKDISWFNNQYFIETRVDTNGGNSFDLVGSSQLLSVPYALHAKTAERLVNNAPVKPYRSKVISLADTRSVTLEDINNTIACVVSTTLKINRNFSSMEIGDTINIEAHNGAVLTITANAGVSLNYVESASAKFTSNKGNVRFGLLRKTDANAYIISGQ